MRKSLMLLAGAAGLALAAGAASAQSTYSWGNSGTTYFYSPSTSDTYSPNAPPVAAIPYTASPQVQLAPPPADPMFYRAPDSYSVYRETPDPTVSEPTHYYNYDDGENLGQGSGIENGVGR